MSRVLLVSFLVVVVIVNLTLAMPAVGDDKEVKSDNDKSILVPEVTGWDTFLSGSLAWPVITASLATVFIVGGAALAFYYFYYIRFYGYSGNIEQGFSPGSGYNPNYLTYGNQPAGRALQGNSFSFTQVLDMIAMAQETYEKFDFQSLDCQKKALCEFQQKHDDFGETGRKISNTFSFMDTLEGLPMPTIIQTYLREYKEAITQGKNSTKDCSLMYPTCEYSIKETFAKYSKKNKI